ncbi:hypothetical protein ScPMuIL_013058 [Solemya velum]
MFSLAVCSEGWYDVPEGTVFSFPVTMSPKGYWNVVQDIDLTDEIKEKIKLAVEARMKNWLQSPKLVDEGTDTTVEGNSQVVESAEDLQDGPKLETIAEDKAEEVEESPPPS